MDGCQEEILLYGEDIIFSKGMLSEKDFIQHGEISCYDHSLNVAAKCVKISDALSLRVDRRALIRGALLHDYFLYDWHEDDDSHKWHGFHHAGKALQNASRDFELSHIERDIIEKHMFPLNKRPPKYLESWVVWFADKICASEEMFHSIGYYMNHRSEQK